MAKLITVDQKIKEVFPTNGKYFELQELYGLIDCNMVETVYLHDNRPMVIDEEGAFKGPKNINIIATKLYKKNRMTKKQREDYFNSMRSKGFTVIESMGGNDSDSIHGNVLVCNPEELR